MLRHVGLTTSAGMLEHSVVLQVQYAALHNFEDREEDFRADVVTLRRRFTSDGAPLQKDYLAGYICIHAYF